MSKKLPHQISLEELLEALEHTTDDVQELVSYKNDVPMFLSKFKLESGDNFVKSATLYKLYNIYSNEPVTRQVFTKTASEFVQFRDPYFRINISPIKLTKILNPQTNANFSSSSSIKKHYDAFIENCAITKGTKWTEGYLLFEVYRFYCIDTKKAKRLSYESFISICEMYFEHRRIGSNRGRWFKLDPDTLNVLTQEHIDKVRLGRKMSDKKRLKYKPKEKK